MVIDMIQNSIIWKYLTAIPFSNLDPPRIQLKQINYRSFIIYNSAEGAICILDGNQNDLKFNRLEIPYSYSLQQY